MQISLLEKLHIAQPVWTINKKKNKSKHEPPRPPNFYASLSARTQSLESGVSILGPVAAPSRLPLAARVATCALSEGAPGTANSRTEICRTLPQCPNDTQYPFEISESSSINIFPLKEGKINEKTFSFFPFSSSKSQL